MPSITEQGTLPIGIEIDGEVHRDFVLRPRLVRDSVDVLEDPLAHDNDAYRGTALIARQIERIGTLTGEQITTDLVLSMFDADMAVIMQANSRLEARLLTFRNQGDDTPQAAPGAVENRGAVAGSA